MRQTRLFLLVTVLLLAAVPSFGTTTCISRTSGIYSWYECISNGDFSSGTTSWSVSPSGNVDTTHSGQHMCGSGWTSYAKSTGAYGFADISQSFTTDSGAKSAFDITLTIDLLHSHSSSANRLGVIVYNLTDNTSETLATIDGSGGDICSTTYSYSVSRPAWKGKNMKLLITEDFWDSDAQFNVSAVSFIQNIFP